MRLIGFIDEKDHQYDQFSNDRDLCLLTDAFYFGLQSSWHLLVFSVIDILHVIFFCCGISYVHSFIPAEHL